MSFEDVPACDDGFVRRGASPVIVVTIVLVASAWSGGEMSSHASASSASRGVAPAEPTESTAATAGGAVDATFTTEAFPVPGGSGPHDVSPAIDGGVWFTAQHSGELGLLDPASGATHMIDLGDGSRPHGVITAADGAAWVTDSGRNSIIRVDQATEVVNEYPLPDEAAGANLNTAVFGDDGVLWFTGQSGWYGKVDTNGALTVFPAPEGRGPYGITATPSGEIYFASLAGSYVGRIDRVTGETTVLEPPVPDQGSRRVWADSEGKVWVSGWGSGDVFVFDPASGDWRSWRLPGDHPMPYAVFVDETDAVWLSDFGANALVRFDPTTETFTTFPLPSPDGAVRQLHGRPGEVWGAESAADQLVVVRHSQ
jgi:virginiamycin B lyase